MAIIGGIPHFQTYPYVDFDFATTATGKSLESFGHVGTGRIAPVSGGVWQKRGAFVFLSSSCPCCGNMARSFWQCTPESTKKPRVFNPHPASGSNGFRLQSLVQLAARLILRTQDIRSNVWQLKLTLMISFPVSSNGSLQEAVLRA